MKLTFALFGLAVFIQSIVAEPCNGIVISNHVQEAEVLMRDVQSPYQLVIDRDTNTLFFSYTSTGENTFESVYINLKDGTSGTVAGVSGGFAHAVDYQKEIVYIGGSDGIYKFDYKTKRAVNLEITDKSIWQMFFKDGLYFSLYPEETAYVYRNGEAKLVPGLEHQKAMLVAVDRNNIIFFARSGELKKIVGGETVTVGEYNVNAFNTDSEGNLYFSTPEGIFKFIDGKVTKVTTIDNIYGFAVEGDGNIIYASDSSIIRLKSTSQVCVDDEKKNETN